MKVTGIQTLHCDAGWRNYSFVKLTIDEGIVGWSEYDEGFGSPSVTAAIKHLSRMRGRPGRLRAREDALAAHPPKPPLEYWRVHLSQ